MKKYVNKYSISFFIMFTIIMLAASFLISIYSTVQYDIRYDNYLLSENAKILSIVQSDLKQEDLLNVIFEEPDICVKGANIYEDINNDKGTILFFNYELETVYPMIEGEFITKEDFINSRKVAVVGKNIIHDTYIKDGNRYLSVENDEYLVKGIMGHEKRDLVCDNIFILNSTGYFANKENSKNANVHIISSKNSINNAIVNIENILKEKSPNIQVTANESVQFQGENTLFALYVLPQIVKSVISVFLINIIIVNVFWLLSRKREISIKKSLGATNINIMLEIMFQQVIIVIVAYIVAIILHYLIISYTNFGIINYIGVNIEFIKTLKILLYAIIISIVLNLFIIRKVNKIEPSVLMKGR